MKVIGAVLGLALLVSPMTVNAETKIPEEFLMTSLGKLTVCIRAQKDGANKLAAMVKQMQADEPGSMMAEDHEKTMLKMLSGMQTLQQIVQLEADMGKAVVAELMQEYNHSLDDLNAAMKPVVEQTDRKMQELFNDVKDFEQFNQVFVPKMNTCATMIEDLVKDAQNHAKSQESQN